MLRSFVVLITALGTLVAIAGLVRWESREPLEWCVLLMMTLIAAGLRLNLPNIAGTLSVDFVFVLIGLTRLGLSELLLMGCAATAAQLVVHPDRRRAPVPPVFHLASTASAVFVGYSIFHSLLGAVGMHWFAALLAASVALFVMTTFPVAAVIAMHEKRRLTSMWRECNFGALPYYVAAACIAGSFKEAHAAFGTGATLLLMPVGFGIYCAYQRYVMRMAHEKATAEEMAAIHMRTVEALSSAIAAKDLASNIHLQRMQIYCLDLASELRLNAEETQALRAAAVLHDIGTLAVPGHILSKPGRLTREEFEKVKIHPLVGAEILDRVGFPYPVAPIVRCHHEKWNGGGYPDGLKGEAIPLGARILSVVDTLDAMLSERPHRPAAPLEVAIDRIRSEAGLSFDPRVVEALARRYRELEGRLAAAGAAPDVARNGLQRLAQAVDGKEDSGGSDVCRPAFLDTIAAARTEAQVILELEQILGRSLRLDDTMPPLSAALKRLIGFDTLALYLVDDGRLVPRYATGDSAASILSRPVPLGSGLCGWVAQNRKPILNGNPHIETGGSENSPARLSLVSALVVPLSAVEGTVGTLMVCRGGFAGFDKDHLRILQAVSAKLASVIENAQKFEQASASATTDFLTGLPNARALFLQLESELARCRRLGGTLIVMVTDLDGFKQVNDRFGHLEGNAVLRAIGSALRQACREYDYVGRMGGDEFVLLLPGMEGDSGPKISLLNRVVAEAGRQVCADSDLALSVGEARFPEDGQDAERLLAIADERMYRSKQTRKLRKHRDAPRGYDFDHANPGLPLT